MTKELIKQLKKSKTSDQIKKPNIFDIYEKAGLCELLSAEILKANELTAAKEAAKLLNSELKELQIIIERL